MHLKHTRTTGHNYTPACPSCRPVQELYTLGGRIVSSAPNCAVSPPTAETTQTGAYADFDTMNEPLGGQRTLRSVELRHLAARGCRSAQQHARRRVQVVREVLVAAHDGAAVAQRNLRAPPRQILHARRQALRQRHQESRGKGDAEACCPRGCWCLCWWPATGHPGAARQDSRLGEAPTKTFGRLAYLRAYSFFINGAAGARLCIMEYPHISTTV